MLRVVKSHVKNIRLSKQAVSRCRITVAAFHFISKFRAKIFHPVLVNRGVSIADCPYKNGCTADCWSLNLRADCNRPQPPPGFLIGLSAGNGNLQYIWKLIAKHLLLLWKIAELERNSNIVKSSPRHFTSKDTLVETSCFFEALPIPVLYKF
jgi:hypothetical protein